MSLVLVPARNAERLNNIVEIHKLVDYLIQNDHVFEQAAEFLVNCCSPKEIWEFYQYKLAMGEEVDPNLPGLLAYTLGAKLNGKRIETGEIRGKVVEIYLIKILEKYCDIKVGCICNRKYIVLGDWKSQKEIDVLYWKNDNTIGEFYECKIDAASVYPPEIHLEYLKNLNDVTRKLLARTLIGLASFNLSEVCIEYLKPILGDDLGVDSYLIVGRDRLKSDKFAERWNLPKGLCS